MRFLKESTEVFDVYGTEVIKNPTDQEYRQLYQEIRKSLGDKYDYQSYEPLIRHTYDNQGNEYIWDSLDSIHYYIENAIKKKYGVKVNQNKNFDCEKLFP